MDAEKKKFDNRLQRRLERRARQMAPLSFSDAKVFAEAAGYELISAEGQGEADTLWKSGEDGKRGLEFYSKSPRVMATIADFSL